jgi:hypothetical protein
MLDGRRDLEHAINSLARAAGVNPKEYQSTRQLVRSLGQQDIVEPQLATLLDDLRKIGNRAAHNPGAITRDEAVQYRALLDQAIGRMQVIQSQYEHARSP